MARPSDAGRAEARREWHPRRARQSRGSLERSVRQPHEVAPRMSPTHGQVWRGPHQRKAGVRHSSVVRPTAVTQPLAPGLDPSTRDLARQRARSEQGGRRGRRRYVTQPDSGRQSGRSGPVKILLPSAKCLPMGSKTFKKPVMVGDASWALRLQALELALEIGVFGAQALELQQCVDGGRGAHVPSPVPAESTSLALPCPEGGSVGGGRQSPRQPRHRHADVPFRNGRSKRSGRHKRE